MTGIHISIRLDLPNGNRIGPGKIALLEAIEAKGSITAAARHLSMCYRRAWLLVQDINNTLEQPAVTTTRGGATGSTGATVTPVGERIIKLYHSIEGVTHKSTHLECLAIDRLVRPRTHSIATQESMLARHLKRLEIARQLNSKLKRKSARMLKVTKEPEPRI
jgi:molybdate transport system regulatory protein